MSSSEPLAYLNGAWLPVERMQIPVHDAGFVMGATVTDLCRTFRHRLYRWPDHLARFRRNCRDVSIKVVATDEEITTLAEKLTSHNAALLPAEDDLALVLLATPGPIGYYAGQPGSAGDAPPTFGIHTFPLPWPRFRGLFTHGAHLVVPSIRQVPVECVPPHIKQRSRMHWWLAEREARARDAGATALLVDAHEHVTETAAANFLIVQEGVVLSPPRSTILEGISLQVVEELCGELSLRFEERRLTMEQCLKADEALLSNTSYCIAGVSRLSGQALPWPGPVLQKLQAAWSTKVGLDIAGQILGRL